MRNYRHKLTGKTAMLPDTGFYRNHPHLVLVDSSEDCDDCKVVVPQMESLIIVDEEDDNDDEESNEG